MAKSVGYMYCKCDSKDRPKKFLKNSKFYHRTNSVVSLPFWN